jgi:tetratricopeptide (TPR) repeat protein
MHLQFESKSREAFDFVTTALTDLDRYRQSREMSVLEAAKASLANALSKDPLYFRAHYLDAIVDDLRGRPAEAVDTFKRLLDERPPFVDEVRYNLGVAEYHHYYHEALDRALPLFRSLAQGATELSLRLLAETGVAQASAMHMIPKDPRNPDRAAIERYYADATSAAKSALDKLAGARRRWWRSAKRTISDVTAAEIEWAAENARGMALMFFTDYFPVESMANWQKQRVNLLRKAVAALERADKVSPRNWANYCDRASARMRLARYKDPHRYFDEAINLLDQVIDHLRPGYGFAMYEKGRVFRLRGDFPLAIDQFEAVLRLPNKDRVDIGDRRVNIELDRARAGETTFP